MSLLLIVKFSVVLLTSACGHTKKMKVFTVFKDLRMGELII